MLQRNSLRDRVVNNHFYHTVHKKEEGTYHRIEKLMKEMPGFLSPGRGLPLLLIPEYSGINKEQRIPDRSKTAHRKPPVKCILTSPQATLLTGLGPRPSSSLSWPLPWGCSTEKAPTGGPFCNPSSRMGAAPHSGATAVSR